MKYHSGHSRIHGTCPRIMQISNERVIYARYIRITCTVYSNDWEIFAKLVVFSLRIYRALRPELAKQTRVGRKILSLNSEFFFNLIEGGQTGRSSLIGYKKSCRSYRTGELKNSLIRRKIIIIFSFLFKKCRRVVSSVLNTIFRDEPIRY